MESPNNDTQAIPSEEQIVPVLDKMLRTSDLNQMTLRIVMRQLAEHFNVDPADLAARKKFVRRSIENFLSTVYSPAKEEIELKNNQREAQAQSATVQQNGNDEPNSEMTNEHVNGGEDDLQDDAQDDGEDGIEGGSCSDSDGEKKPQSTKKRRKPAASSPSSPRQVTLTNLEKAVILAEPLANFLGEVVLPRTHVPKRIQKYVKDHGLQDPKDRRIIRCDDALKAVFHTDTFTFFSLNKLTTNLLYKAEEIDDKELQKLVEECNANRLVEKQKEYDEKVAKGEPVRNAKRTKTARGRQSSRTTRSSDRKPTGLQCPMQLSEQLAAVCGAPVMSRSEVVSKIWAYIRENKLQNRGKIKCDAKLQAVFEGSKEVTNFGFNKYLSAHLSRID